jgi:hypothetical protein
MVLNQELQARGFECLVEHHDIQRVTSSKDHVLFQYRMMTTLKFLLHQWKEAYAKALQPKPLWKLCST